MVTYEDIRWFIKESVGSDPKDPETDIWKDLGVAGDDFHEMIEAYAKTFDVDLTGYLWYFHAEEEGLSLGGFLFKPPYARVTRIAVTPRMLLRCAVIKKWDLEYPEHKLPNRRIDLLIDKVFAIIMVLISLLLMILSFNR